jgi:hypothetical protein
LADELRSIEPPGAEFEEVPRHPLERFATVQGSARVIGAACGLAWIFARRVAGATRAATTSRARRCRPWRDASRSCSATNAGT